MPENTENNSLPLRFSNQYPMDASYWGEIIRPPGGLRGGSRHRSRRAGNKFVQPTSVGNYTVKKPHAKPVETNCKPLDPNAKAWSPVIQRAPEEDRCLFITFSNGYPLTKQEIARFFNHKYGDCLERIYIHWPHSKNNRDTVTPQFGKVVFKSCSIPLVITNCGKKQSRFTVYGKPLWCKMFDPKKTQACTRN